MGGGGGGGAYSGSHGNPMIRSLRTQTRMIPLKSSNYYSKYSKSPSPIKTIPAATLGIGGSAGLWLARNEGMDPYSRPYIL